MTTLLQKSAAKGEYRPIQVLPAYVLAEASRYLRIPAKTLEYWVTGSRRTQPLIKLAQSNPPMLSFMNLLEAHVLVAMRKEYNLKPRKVRYAILTLNEHFPSPHPLLDRVLQTDSVDVFVDDFDQLVNLSRGGQGAFREILQLHLTRIERDATGLYRFFPFVMERSFSEPRLILIDPAVGFGKPVISGTGISTGIVAARFEARDSIPDLASEYGCAIQAIEEAVRWEQARPIAA